MPAHGQLQFAAANYRQAENAGPAMNLVPRQGGNRFSGSLFATGANESVQADNFTPELEAQRSEEHTSEIQSRC